MLYEIVIPNTMRTIEAILFDLDGVLINSFESWYHAFNEMLRAYGKEEIGRAEFREKCWGPDLELSNHFDVIVTGDDVKNGKPNAEMVVAACEKLTLKPENVILVGDTEIDFQAGKSAGCAIVGVRAKPEGGERIDTLFELFPLLPLH